MGNSDISITMNVYMHMGFDDAEEELRRMEEFRKAQEEIKKEKRKIDVTETVRGCIIKKSGNAPAIDGTLTAGTLFLWKSF